MENTKRISICRLINKDGNNVATRVAEEFDVSRQTASAWLSSLIDAGTIAITGSGRGTTYSLVNTYVKNVRYTRAGLSEDLVWRDQLASEIKDLPDNVRGIWHHGLTEIVNNAIDHSGSEFVTVLVIRNALYTECVVSDTGEGIFLKIQRALDLYDPRESILELAKGKFTTDPANHSGEGIFFSSKMFDEFFIRSGDLCFVHTGSDGNDIFLTSDASTKGTEVHMLLDNDSLRTTKEVFDKFALPEEFSFAKTIVPVRLAQYEGETLVSRSQAKRLTRRFERFQTVIVDFSGVEEIGQAFADEVFRVFANEHPALKMVPIHMTASVKAMMRRVQNAT